MQSGMGWNVLDFWLADGVNSGQGLGIEIIGTLQLVLCVLATTDRRRRDLGGSAPLAIGLSVALGHLLAIDYTGCGINPARSFGSAVITHNFSNHWIFWVGPFIGGALAVLIYDFILAPRSSDLTDRVKVWTSGQVEEYDLDADDINSRVEMKPK
ncbi:aquaporin 1 (Colton blood group) [Homo sapiens]|uniref:Aquaporin-1 n=2 Tax=Simiiformes TaxID=314293 RepID=A0A2K5SES1_CEBIM|nr:aquaporin 1 (Colton blood group) [Homo sapiens]KAI4013353.1 aquaporin 1 (Colton blood group) [Homo sapiens]